MRAGGSAPLWALDSYAGVLRLWRRVVAAAVSVAPSDPAPAALASAVAAADACLMLAALAALAAAGVRP